MSLISSALLPARIIQAAALILSALFLPVGVTLAVAILGAILFPFYAEGLIMIFVLELAVGPSVADVLIPFAGTLAVIGAALLSALIKPRLVSYT